MAFRSPTGIENLTGLYQHANYLTGYNFGWAILLAWFIIGLVILIPRYETKGAFLVASVQVAVLGILFRVLNLVNDFVMYFVIIGAIISVGIALKG